MDWSQAPALIAAAAMVVTGMGALVRPGALEWVGVQATSPIGASELRAVFGGMFIALGAACIALREPVVFGVVGAAWFADLIVRLATAFVDRVPARDALRIFPIALVMGLALTSGWWLA